MAVFLPCDRIDFSLSNSYKQNIPAGSLRGCDVSLHGTLTMVPADPEVVPEVVPEGHNPVPEDHTARDDAGRRRLLSGSG